MSKEIILDTIYFSREQDILDKKSEFEKQVEYEIKKQKNEEKLRLLIEQVYSKKLSKKIEKYLDLTLEDILKSECTSLDKYYKQGFKDGVNLLIECLL